MIGDGAAPAPDCVPTGSSLASALESSAPPSSTPAQALLPDSTIAPPRTRLQDGIKKSKQYTNDIVRYAYFANYVVSYTMQEALAVPRL
jgi:hypothetical protein